MLDNGAPGAPAAAGSDWRRPSEDDAFRRYAATLQLHRWLIVICVLVGTGAAIAYATTAKSVYKAEADLFISPVSSADTVTVALGLITASGNPTSDIETAAQLVTTINAARAVQTTLRLHDSPQQILNAVTAQPVAQSDIVALTAQAGGRQAAANLANAFVNTVILQRTAQLHALIRREIANVHAQLIATPPRSADAGVLSAQLAQLGAVLNGPLPDMRVSTMAVPPTARSSPRITLDVLGGVLGGLALGLALAFVLAFVDVRVRSQQQLQRLFRLPVLGLVPREGRAPRGLGRLIVRLPVVGILAERQRVRRSVPRAPETLSPHALEAYRTLRATLLASRPQLDRSRSILVTSASAGEGKTTTAINLAFSLATSGKKVILIEADVRRPSIAKALGLKSRLVKSRHDLSSVLTKQVSLSAALVDSPSHGANLRFLLAHSQAEPGPMIGDALLLPTAAVLLSEALEMAEYVIVDSPPLAEVIDALELARLVDDLLIVVRLAQTRVPRLLRLGELLARTDIIPVGIALIGVEPPKGFGSYAYGYASYSPRMQPKARSEMS
jgi:Mrp family chromosome partitioning ATPase/capsular polysaccharide biosynthesis protein